MVSGHRPFLSHIAYLGLASAVVREVAQRPATVREREPADELAPQPMTLPQVEALPRAPAPKTAAEIRAEVKRARKNARRLALTPEHQP